MKSELINTSRKGWIDALRGLAILLVIYGHCSQKFTEFFVFTSPVKMPLFFAISGYVINENITLKTFFEKLFKKVVVPWIVLGLSFPVLLIVVKGLYYPIEYFLQMLSGEILWFMPCFIIAQPIHFIFRKYLKKLIWIILASGLCFVSGLMMHKNGLMNYAMFNTALVVQPFFLIGFLFKRYGQMLMKMSWFSIISLTFLYIVLCWLGMRLFPGQTIDVHLSHYFNIPCCMLLIILGCSVLFIAAQKSNFSSFTMSFIGQNTLILYMWHGLAIMFLVKGLSILGCNMPVNSWTALIKMICAILICGIAAIAINRFVPWVVGKEHRT